MSAANRSTTSPWRAIRHEAEGVVLEFKRRRERYTRGKPPGQVVAIPVGLWLLRVDGDELFRVGRQTGGQPFLVLYTGDLDAALEWLTTAGGEVRRPPRSDGRARFAHVADLYGNELVLTWICWVAPEIGGEPAGPGWQPVNASRTAVAAVTGTHVPCIAFLQLV